MAQLLGVVLRTYATYERGDRTPTAESLELLVQRGWNANWLLTGQGNERLTATGENRVAEDAASYGPASQDLSGEHLSIALELADEALQGLWLPKRRYADLVALIYDGLTQGLPYAAILEIARPAAAQHAQQGAGDGGGQGMDPAGQTGSGRREAG